MRLCGGEGSPVKFWLRHMLQLPYCPGGWPVSIRMRQKVILCWWITNMTMLTLNLQVRICTLRTLKRLKKTKISYWKAGEQVTLKGDKKWQGKIYSNNGYAQFSANNFEGEVDTWFISPAVAVTSKDAGLSFDIKFGYYNADCRMYWFPIHMREMVRLIWHSGLA